MPAPRRIRCAHETAERYVQAELAENSATCASRKLGRIREDDVMHRDQLAKAVAELHTALAKV
jgi:CHAD domain-containing protein